MLLGFLLKWHYRRSNDGGYKLGEEIYNYLVHAPHDMLPSFEGPPNSKLVGGKGKDHPLYGRFTYAFGRWVRPHKIVEVGTYAGGTSIGWAQAILDNEMGHLICVDNDSYSQGTYPTITRRNLEKVGLKDDQFELRNGNSPDLLKELAEEMPGSVDIYLVDGDHTYEGALKDLQAGLPMVRRGGFILVHDVDRGRLMDEATREHPFPVYEAMMDFIEDCGGYEYTILKFIRKHLAVIKVA